MSAAMIIIDALTALVELAERPQPSPSAGGRLRIFGGGISLGGIGVDLRGELG